MRMGNLTSAKLDVVSLLRKLVRSALIVDYLDAGEGLEGEAEVEDGVCTDGLQDDPEEDNSKQGGAESCRACDPRDEGGGNAGPERAMMNHFMHYTSVKKFSHRRRQL